MGFLLLPNGLKEIQYFAFSNLDKVTKVEIPNSVKIIGKGAFSFCYCLNCVNFEEGSKLEKLQEISFLRTKITSFQIPENVNSIIVNFIPIEKLTNLTIHPKNMYLKFSENAIISANGSVLFAIYNKSIQTYEIPNTITTIYENCFYESKIISIIIPEKVNKIGDHAFYWCKFLKKYYIFRTFRIHRSEYIFFLCRS